jgi:hypothetical protein
VRILTLWQIFAKGSGFSSIQQQEEAVLLLEIVREFQDMLRGVSGKRRPPVGAGN